MENDSPKSAGRLHFKNPPIIEAVIALSIVPLPESVIEKFQGLVDEMKAAGYRQPEPVTEHQIQFKIEREASSFDKSASPLGLKFFGVKTGSTPYSSIEMLLSLAGSVDMTRGNSSGMKQESCGRFTREQLVAGKPSTWGSVTLTNCLSQLEWILKSTSEHSLNCQTKSPPHSTNCS